MSAFDAVIATLKKQLGEAAVLSSPSELIVYECDAVTMHRRTPLAVVLPNSTGEVAVAVKACHDHQVPFVPRGAGTGLSGGAVPISDAILIETSRMRRVLELDFENRFARVEAGLVNVEVSKACEHARLHYAPDPSSQTVCTVGGNVAENSGGPHCLKYGATTNHILALRVVLPNGEVIDLGREDEWQHGYDLRGAFIGSEGTLGIATEITVRLVPTPPAIRTMLFPFPELDASCEAVGAIIRAGIVPAALEILDQNTIEAVEASPHFRAGYPTDAAAVLLVELDGLEAGIESQVESVTSLCRSHGALEVHRAQTAQERAALWRGRKGAFGAMGRLAPDLFVQDVVVPRTRLPEIIRDVVDIGAQFGLRVSNVFHAGDGNLHPNITYDRRDEDEVARVRKAGSAIIRRCLEVGGTLSGEHGIGLDKAEYMSLLFTSDDLESMARLREVFNPGELCNPGKILPSGGGCFDRAHARLAAQEKA
ncbi:MAG: FAD-linked oxidase C-terminal domain-containing protein [Planctomycetota bacterium]